MFKLREWQLKYKELLEKGGVKCPLCGADSKLVVNEPSGESEKYERDGLSFICCVAPAGKDHCGAQLAGAVNERGLETQFKRWTLNEDRKNCSESQE